MTPASGSLSRRTVAAMFASFAFAYFIAAILRAVIATLAPEFSAELELGAADLGLLAGAFSGSSSNRPRNLDCAIWRSIAAGSGSGRP